MFDKVLLRFGNVCLRDDSTYPLVNIAMLKLHEASADGCDVALLVGERHAPGPLRVLEFWVGVDAGVAHPTVQPIHDHRQLH